MIETVVFDMGGVIFTATPDPDMRLAFAAETIKLVSAHGVHIPDSPEVFAEKLEIADKIRKHDNEKALIEFPPLECWADYYLKEYGATREQLFPIAEELCFRWNSERNVAALRRDANVCMQALYDMGLRLAIISNTISRTYVPTLLAEYGLSRYFELVILSSVTGLRKPDAAIFELCRTALGSPDKDTLCYVGDTISRDVIGTRNAKWGTMVRIHNRIAKRSEKVREDALEESSYKPDYEIEELTELPALIRSLNAK